MVDLTHDLRFNHKVAITKQSLDERFNKKTIVFTKQLLSEALNNIFTPLVNENLFPLFNKVRIKDSTSFVLPENMANVFPGNGGNSSDAKAQIQFEYDIKSNKIEELSVHSIKTNDYKSAYDTIDTVNKKDLLIRDLGYISIDLLETIQSKGAYFVNRIKPQTAIYEKKNGKYCPISFKSIQKQLRKQGIGFIAKQLYIGWRKYMPCRVVFFLVPDDKINEKLKRQNGKTKRRNSSSTDKRIIQYIDLNIFITNTSEGQISAYDLYNVYKLRWQIELIFKSWKSICNINKIKKAKPERIETCIYIQLLWVITNWAIIQTFANFFLNIKKKFLSIYKAYKLLLIVTPMLRKAYHNKHKMVSFIDKMGKVFEEKCLREKRKGRVFSEDILLSFTR